MLVYSVTIHNQRRFIHPQKYGLFQSSIRSKRELMTEQAYLHMHNWWRNFIMFCYSIICFAIRSDKICCISSLSMHGNEINHFRRKKLYMQYLISVWGCLSLNSKKSTFWFHMYCFPKCILTIVMKLRIFYISLFFGSITLTFIISFENSWAISAENDQNKINFGSNACLFQRSLMTHKYLKLIFYHSVDAG